MPARCWQPWLRDFECRVADLACWRVLWSMIVFRRRRSRSAFELFVERVEPPLHRALVATYGVVDGRAATADALSWAWEHCDRIVAIEHPVGYLYRVGQSATRRSGARPMPIDPRHELVADLPEIDVDLLPALGSAAGAATHGGGVGARLRMATGRGR